MGEAGGQCINIGALKIECNCGFESIGLQSSSTAIFSRERETGHE